MKNNPFTFSPSSAPRYFTNVSFVESQSFDSRSVFRVTDAMGSDTGALTYWGESNQWDIYVDNFPSPKRYFSSTIPVNTIGDMVADAARCGLSLSVAPECRFPIYMTGIAGDVDCLRNEIIFVVSVTDRTKFIKLSVKKLALYHANQFDPEREIESRHHLLSSIWAEKYDEPMPDDIEHYNAETLRANAFGYAGVTELTLSEYWIIDNVAELFDLTYDVVWFVVEGLGWRPSSKISKDNVGWELLRARFADHDPQGTLSLVERLVTIA